jgi:hypothetical protein
MNLHDVSESFSSQGKFTEFATGSYTLPMVRTFLLLPILMGFSVAYAGQVVSDLEKLNKSLSKAGQPPSACDSERPSSPKLPYDPNSPECRGPRYVTGPSEHDSNFSKWLLEPPANPRGKQYCGNWTSKKKILETSFQQWLKDHPDEEFCPDSGRGKCQRQIPMAKHDRYDAWIAAAANMSGIDPSIIKSLLFMETGITPLAENESEKKNPVPGYKWGKGLCQMGANNASLYGLDWKALKPAKVDDAYMKKNCLRPGPEGLFPIWCPNAAIMAMGLYLRFALDTGYQVNQIRKVPPPSMEELMKKPLPENYFEAITPKTISLEKKDIKGRTVKQSVRVDVLYTRNAPETGRYLAGMYNRGQMPINSLSEYVRQKKKFPLYYGQVWAVERLTDSPNAPMLAHEYINRCYVWKMGGLCGDEPQGHMKTFGANFQRDEHGSFDLWRVKSI